LRPAHGKPLLVLPLLIILLWRVVRQVVEILLAVEAQEVY
jgi:hypothetical protein